jgi:cold shock CspA family protein/ribosome-associated translation inhibitor RaiA
MILSTQVTFRNMTAIADVRETIETRIQKLETFCRPILSCRVMIEAPANHHRKGDPFHVRIDATLTDGRIVVKHAESLYPVKREIEGEQSRKGRETTSERNCLMLTIRGAFNAARRQLQEHARLRRADVKTHEANPVATVTRIFPEAGFGYLETSDGREVYFHANSVLGSSFKKLRTGSKAQIVEEPGLKGPQASTVRIIRKSQAAMGLSPASARRRR